MFFFVALKYMPLADTIAVFFVEPMVVLLLSAVFLGEVVGWPRRIASLIAFGGALLIIQPSYELFGPVSLLPLLAALCFASYFIVTRRLTAKDHPLTMQFWSGIGGMLLATTVLGAMAIIGDGAPVDYRFTMPSSTPVLQLAALLGVVSTIAHVSITTATSLAPVSILAPFNYLEIVSATLLGYVFFDEFPGGVQWLGISIIVAMGFVIFVRERALERKSSLPVQPLRRRQ